MTIKKNIVLQNKTSKTHSWYFSFFTEIVFDNTNNETGDEEENDHDMTERCNSCVEKDIELQESRERHRQEIKDTNGMKGR